MPTVNVGDRVSVDLAGVNSGGVSFGQGVSAGGVVLSIDAIRQEATVKLDIAFNGISIVTVPASRLSV